MGFLSHDKKTTVTNTETHTAINDSRIGAADNAIVTKQGNINLTSTNAPKEFFDMSKAVGLGALETALELSKVNTEALTSSFKSQSDFAGDLFSRSASTIGGLAETKISDGANITAGTMRTGLYVLGGIALLFLLTSLKK